MRRSVVIPFTTALYFEEVPLNAEGDPVQPIQGPGDGDVSSVSVTLDGPDFNLLAKIV